MASKNMIVGGEFVFSPTLFLKPDLHQFSDYGSELSGYSRYYTFGGYYSLKAVIRHLNFQPGEYALLPAYLCPTIIEPFRQAGVMYDFYKLKEGLLPDLEDIAKKAVTGLKAVLFIDYFGFPQMNYLTPIIGYLKAQGVVTIQDTVQSWLDNESDLYGDFCLNSVRKIAPFEAGVLFSRVPMDIIPNNRSRAKFLLHKRYAQILRYYHIRYGLFKPENFLKHIDESNQHYHHDRIMDMPPINSCLLNRIDFAALGRKRKIVFAELKKRLNPRMILQEPSSDSVPLGLAVYLENRDALKAKLHALDIHCPLHWLLSDEIDKNEHEYCWDLQYHELTIPVNVQLTQLHTYISNLQEVL
ncbi:MAG TPA: hypothetical protein PLA08_01220 [Candidatus Cloacimonadota bacterium]|nr:hypothetical protein [Candidatus Cloacimonadota bacterium]